MSVGKGRECSSIRAFLEHRSMKFPLFAFRRRMKYCFYLTLNFGWHNINDDRLRQSQKYVKHSKILLEGFVSTIMRDINHNEIFNSFMIIVKLHLTNHRHRAQHGVQKAKQKCQKRMTFYSSLTNFSSSRARKTYWTHCWSMHRFLYASRDRKKL